MALIDCPSCGKKISSKAETCNHCHISLSDNSPERNATLAKRKRNKRILMVGNLSLVTLILFLAGAFIVFYLQPDQEDILSTVGIAGLAIGSIGYMGARTWLMFLKGAK